MTEDLSCLISQATRDLSNLAFHRQILEMAQEQLEKEDKALRRIEILLDIFLSRFDCYEEDLRTTLGNVQDLLEAERIKNRLAELTKNAREGS